MREVAAQFERPALLFSGGKDSTLALHLAAQKEQVVCLITVASKNKESYMFHTPNIDVTALQAEALGLPLSAMTRLPVTVPRLVAGT